MNAWAALLSAALLAAPPAAPERVAVLAVHDPPSPDGELSELAHQLRAAATDRVAGVLTAPEMRDRLAGKSGGATVQELDRAFGGALAVYQNGEYESAARTLRAIVDDLEDLPESEAVWAQWVRAMARLAHVHQSMKQLDERDAVLVTLLKADSSVQLEPTLYSQTFRAHLDELRQKVRSMPKRRLTVSARGRAGTIYVAGRDVGPTPATVILAAGPYRVAGAAGALRIPSFTVDLGAEDKSVVLDFALAETFRPGAGPGMVLPGPERAGAIIRAGAWLGVERLVVASRASEAGAHFLVGAIYDVRRGALLREGSVRMVSGGVPAANLGALASFLLLGQSSREVLDRTREPLSQRPPAPRPPLVVAAAAAAAAPGPASAPALASATNANPSAAAVPGPAVQSAPAAQSKKPTAEKRPAPSAPAASPPASPGAAPAAAGAAGIATASGSPAPSAPLAAGPQAAAPAPAASHATAAPVAVPSSHQSASPQARPAAGDTTPSPDLHPAPPPDDPLARSLAGAGAPEPGRDPPPRWLRPTAYATGIAAALLAGLAIQQGVVAHGEYADADAMIGPGGAVVPGGSYPAHQAAIARGDEANRNAWVAGSAAVLSAATAGVLAWLSRDPAPAP